MISKSAILQEQPVNSKVPHLVKCFESQVILILTTVNKKRIMSASARTKTIKSVLA